jgi:hypothetical protein
MKKYTGILRWFYRLSWKKIVGAGLFILTIAVMPTALKVAQNPTRTRSEAALLPQPQPVTSEFETPTGPPVIYLVDHFFGKVGDAVLIHGENLGGFHEDSFVSLNGKLVGVENLISWTGSYIEFTVPELAQTGKLEVGILGQRTSWEGTFFVTDENTEAELRLVDGFLKAKEIAGGSELLVWFLVINGEGKVSLTSENGVKVEMTSVDLPIGKIYKAKLQIPSRVASQSRSGLVNLLKITKSDEMLIGIARGELKNTKGGLIPLQLHPLYVSF